MGGPMAANVLRAGHELRVTDLRREVAAELIANGATWVDTAAEAAEGAEAIFLSLPKPPDVEKVVLGDNGVLAGAASGSTIIDLSTNSPTVVQALGVTAGAKGVGFLDGPVSGGVRGARNATLAVMVGGDLDLFQHFKPVLDASGTNVFHTGALGTGNVAKLINNMLAFIGMMGSTEAIVLGAKAGLDPNVLRKIVMAGSGQSFAWESGTRAILRDRLAPTFSTSLASKDIGLAVTLADEMGVPVTMGRAAQARIDDYRENGYADEDVLATVKAIEELANYQVRGQWQDEPAS